ncbi:hypothetical protein A7N72_01625 [Listeria monocytogenes]|nr:hypothetical protein A0I77_03870 [Listeria monocytogenes]PCY12298.1 hypothetical protein A7N72_01625 [Listeria monocytogenes]PDQ59991.1 hypothetical protein A0I84_03080 [Listeria monocytogenes]
MQEYHKKAMYNQKCNEMSDSCRERLENGAYLEIFLHNVSIIKFFGHKIILIMSYYSHFKHSCFYLSQKIHINPRDKVHIIV